MPECEVEISGERLTLLADKAVWWAARKTLFIADVHLGKIETFQRYAISLPSGSTGHDLQRLTQLIDATRAERLVVLGDWLHAKSAQTPFVHQQIQQWRDAHANLQLLLVQGNHDRHAGDVPSAWRIDSADEGHQDAPFIYAHYPQEHEGGYVFAGHLHPAVQLRGYGKQIIKQACFWVRPRYMVLPAFGSFTGTALLQTEPSDKIFVLVSASVLPLRKYDS